MSTQYAEDDGEIVDPEIEALLDFDPVPRKVHVEGGWTPENQRAFIARLAVHGSACKACEEIDKNRTGATKLYRSPHGASFRAAWDGAVELAKRRQAEQAQPAQHVSASVKPPTLDHRRKYPAEADGPLPGQVMNEFGEWEDEASLKARGQNAHNSIAMKLLRARRHYLLEISGCPGKRAAFEILTELPIDWEAAERFEPQPDEPWARPNMREPDMLLTAENGWLGKTEHGPDKMAQLQKALDEYRAAEGLPAIDWDGE